MRTLYKLTFTSGKSYIGQTKRKMKTRLNQHRCSAINSKSFLAVHCAWRKYGDPVCLILGEFDSDDELHEAEILAIKEHNTLSPFGYNLSLGGDTSPSSNPDVAAKIAAKAKGRKIKDVSNISAASKRAWESTEYREKVLAGVKSSWSEEKRLIRSEKMKEIWKKRKSSGWVMPEVTKDKLRGKIFSSETREKMSVSAKKRGMSEDVRLAGVMSVKGKKIGPYDKERVRKAAAGVKAAWQDPEKRARMTEARKQAWETRRAKL